MKSLVIVKLRYLVPSSQCNSFMFVEKQNRLDMSNWNYSGGLKLVSDKLTSNKFALVPICDM